jgi:hypothetical protein
MEDDVKTASNNLIIEKIKKLREIYNNSSYVVESKVEEQKKYWIELAQNLNIEEIHSTRDLLNYKREIENKIANYKQKANIIEQDITEKVLSNLNFHWNIHEIDLIIEIKKQLKELENQKKLQTKIKISNMQFINEDELDAFWGKCERICPSFKHNHLSYISGIPCADEFIKQSSTSSEVLVSLGFRPEGLHIKFGIPEPHYIGLSHENIQAIDFEHKEQIINKKNKSVIGRAITGGLICIPFGALAFLGAIIGGMSGIGYKEKKAKMPDLFLAINYKNNNNEYMILFSTQYKRKAEIDAFFNSHFIEKFRSFSTGSLSSNDSKVENESEADKIRKFKKLFDEGIITKEEFEAKKKQILSI